MNKKDVMNVESLFILSSISKNSGKRQAAKEYNASVDTINKYIDSLEKELGFKLLSSNGRGSILTPRAEELIVKVEEIEDILKKIYTYSPDRKDVSGDVRVGLSIVTSTTVFPKDIGDFFDNYPNISLTVMTALDEDFNDAKISNVDIAVTTFEPTSPDLVVVSKRKIDCGFFASPEYLSRHTYPVDIADLISNHRIVGKIGADKRVPVWVDIQKGAKKLCFNTNSTYSIIEVIRNSLGIGILPLRYKDDGLVCLDNIKCDADVTFYLVAHKSTKDIPRIRTVLDYIKELLENI